MVVAAIAFGVVVAMAVGCSGDDGGDRAATTSTSTSSTPTTAVPTTTAAPPTTAFPPPPPSVWPAIDPTGRVRAVVAAGGFVLPVLADPGDGTYEVATPCQATAVVAGTPLRGAHVVLDPGHGGRESGAIGPSGLLEKDVNLDIALRVKDRLEAAGAVVALARTGDQYTSIASRAHVAQALQPLAFVSIHHNAEPDGPSAVPGVEAYYQLASSESKRLSGLIWEELQAAFSAYAIDWAADTDHGAKYRESGSGGDYYGILRRSAGIPTVLSEAAFISNPPEEQLLATAEFRQVEADALARAITRFGTTDDEGGGFVEPYPRDSPAGGGGGNDGCVDPPL